MERRRQGRGKERGGKAKGMKGEMGVKFENTHFINEREGEETGTFNFKMQANQNLQLCLANIPSS